MKITITDANIFIDLIKLQLLGHLFNLGIEIYTTREVVDQLNESQYQTLEPLIQSDALIIYAFSSDELSAITAMGCPRALEFPDKTVVFLATKMAAEVLTGDGPLRKFCTQKGLTVRGILWLFDEFLAKKLINYAAALEKLQELMGFNSRLPKDDCMHRIRNWQGKS